MSIATNKENTNSSGVLDAEIRKIYRYKLNYIDFLKMAVSDLYKLERYLYLQTEPIEVEVYLEEILMSVNHNDFNLGMTEFAKEYYKETENLVSSLVTEETEEGREFFKVQLTSNKNYLAGLIKSYMSLIEVCKDIQFKLLSKVDNSHSPVTIVCSSYILNRLATMYTEQYSGKRVSLEDARELTGIKEAQVRDLHVEMSCITPNNLELSELRTKFKGAWTSNSLKGLTTKGSKTLSVHDKQFVEALQIMEMYDSITTQPVEQELKAWLAGGVGNIKLPYFNSPCRAISSDWHYRHIVQPRGAK